MDARIWLGPMQPELLADAINRGGGVLVPIERANAIVWAGQGHADPLGFAASGGIFHSGIRWVQLEAAGVDDWFRAGLIDDRRVWTAAKGVFAPQVAEHVLAFVLAAAKKFPQLARERAWSTIRGGLLADRTVGIIGAGGIGRSVIDRLGPFGVRTIALTRSGRPVPGAEESVGPNGLRQLLTASDYVVLSVPLTIQTHHLIGAPELDLIGPEGWLINVARGRLVETDALVTALRDGRIGGACLDVTDPEPLPAAHPLWDFANVLITPHVANHRGLFYQSLAKRVAENVERFRRGRELIGAVDVAAGY
jgi:phosphoglycerate dehydrogenase-like enzyme